MKFLVIVGSARKSGTSAQVVDIIEKNVPRGSSLEVVWLDDYKITICDGDNACAFQTCKVKDDVERIVTKMLVVDAIVYLPVMHAYGTNSLFQAFIERVGYGFMRPLNRPLKNKIAIIAVVGRRYGHTTVYSQIALNVLLNKMILIGSGFPPTFHSQMPRDHEAEQSLTESLERAIELFEASHGALKLHRETFQTRIFAEQLTG